jgi:hypothetical protein
MCNLVAVITAMSMPSLPPENVNGDIIIEGVLCSNIQVGKYDDDGQLILIPQFSDNEGLHGMLIERIKQLMKKNACKISERSEHKNSTVMPTNGIVTVHFPGNVTSTWLKSVYNTASPFTGLLNVTFRKVYVTRMQNIQLDAYLIGYESVQCTLVSDLHSFSEIWS